jgi:hypothetical protein
MRDGAPEYFICAVRDVLYSTYYGQWIGRGLTSRPPCLLDLNPLDFYMWEYLKSLGYTVPVDNEEALHYHSVEACQTISNYYL